MFLKQETYILKALETTDPTQPGPNDAQTSILGGVPLDACHIFTSDSKQETQNRIDRPMPIKTRNTTSTAEDLFNLTADVMKMQAMKQQHRDEDTLGTSADSLVKNATRLLHRHSVNKSTVDGVHPPDSLAASVKTTNTGSHWKKVKAAVKVAGVANDAAAAKKRDEVTEIAETLNEESGNGNVLFDVETGTIKEQSLSNSSKRRKKNGINRVKTGFQEFEDWVMFEKTNMYVYLKLLLFVIIPATGISAM